MEYTYATCILNETGEEINEENLTAVLDAAGVSVIESRVKAIVAALEDIDVDDVTAVDVDVDSDPAAGEDASGEDANSSVESEDTDEANETTIDEDPTMGAGSDVVSTEQSDDDTAVEASSTEPAE